MINNCSRALHQAPSCLACSPQHDPAAKQKPNKLRDLAVGLLQGSPFQQGSWGNGKPLPTTARLLQNNFTTGFSHVSPQKSQQGQDVGSESFKWLCLFHLHISQLGTGPSKPKSLQITTSKWLFSFVILAGNHRRTKSNLSSIAESGRSSEN